MGDQGTRGLESRGMSGNTTARRMSEAPQPTSTTHEEKIPTQNNVDTESPTTEKTQPVEFTVPQYRPLITPSNLATPNEPSPSVMFRNPSSGSSTGPSTPAESGSYFGSIGRRPPAPRPLEPPVTKATLSELDVNKIIHNPKLRHDINFDPELHFRPNLDGEKGRRKQDRANQFWTALVHQITKFVTDRDDFIRQHGQTGDWCLPLLLKSVKDIIQTLVPARDRAYLDEGLNVELIMQQFNRGMADLDKLAAWLSEMLKSHCAPMRDEWVDEMYNQLTNGNKTNNIEELVQGMRSLLSVLEAMKLDVANHQIRCLRPALIEDTVHFERRFFTKKIRDHKLDPSAAANWYARVRQNSIQDQSSPQAFGEMDHFFEALNEMVMPSYRDSCPNTFLFDEERICKLRSDMIDAINLDVCLRLYEDLEKKYRHSDAKDSLQQHAPTDPLAYLSSDLDDDFEMAGSNPSSRPTSLVISSSGSSTDQSSPRASLAMLESSFAAAEEQRNKVRDLHASLIDLLQSSAATSTPTQPGQRWQAAKDSIAIQIFRFTNAPPHALRHFEDSLDRHLILGPAGSDSPLTRDVEHSFQRRLLTELQHCVREYKGLTGVALFSVATGGRVSGPGRTWDGVGPARTHGANSSSHHHRRAGDILSGISGSVSEGREEASIDDMATRLAHLGILHWRVWSELVYHPVVAESDDVEMSSCQYGATL